MIELTQIKTTDTIGQLRGQLNTAFDEIESDQPFLGVPVNPSINYYKKGTTESVDGMVAHTKAKLVATSTASTVTSQLVLLCFPESNGVFVANVWGYIRDEPVFATGYSSSDIDYMSIDVPAVKMPTRDNSISTFVTCEHLGIPKFVGLDSYLYGVISKPLMFMGTPNVEGSYVSRASSTGFIEQGETTCNIIFTVPNVN